MTSCSKELVDIEVLGAHWYFPFLGNGGYAAAGQPQASAVSLAVNNVPTDQRYSQHANGSKALAHNGFETTGSRILICS